MSVRTAHSIFRFRVYKLADESIKEVYGDEAAPTGAEWLLEDVTVEQTTIKTANIESAVKV